jgi:N-acetylglucosamine-6-phosphate deacetylase
MSNALKQNPIPKGLADTKGFIDLQVNGYQDVNFSAPGLSVADIRRITQVLLKRGTAAYCPTVITSDLSVYEQNLPILAKAMAEPDLRDHLLGIHLEGPFIAKAASGAHPQKHIRPPDTCLLDRWQTLSGNRIRILTLAPEVEGAEAIIRHATQQGVVCSLGHHFGDDDSIHRAVNAGATLCTHLGNGIPNTLPRHPNPIWTQMAEDRLIGMFITDGHHLPSTFIRVAIRAKGIHRFIVTSDVAPPGGMPPGEYAAIGGTVVLEPSGRLSVKDKDSLAGSSSTLKQCMQWLEDLGALSPAELMEVGRNNPLRVLGYRVE